MYISYLYIRIYFHHAIFPPLPDSINFSTFFVPPTWEQLVGYQPIHWKPHWSKKSWGLTTFPSSSARSKLHWQQMLLPSRSYGSTGAGQLSNGPGALQGMSQRMSSRSGGIMGTGMLWRPTCHRAGVASRSCCLCQKRHKWITRWGVGKQFFQAKNFYLLYLPAFSSRIVCPTRKWFKKMFSIFWDCHFETGLPTQMARSRGGA